MNARSFSLLVVTLAACRSPAPEAPRTAPVRPATALPSPATPPAQRPASPEPGDWLEPRPPEIECAFTRRERCVTGQPTRTALQRSPFHWCPRTLPAVSTGSLYPVAEAAFSPEATRAARLRDPDACCYVEFVATACD